VATTMIESFLGSERNCYNVIKPSKHMLP